jgi:hypothetical protein
MSVKRWTQGEIENEYAVVKGDFVDASDYDALVAELEQVRQQRDKCAARLDASIHRDMRLAEAERLLRVAYSLHGAIEAAAVSHDFQMQYVRFWNHREATPLPPLSVKDQLVAQGFDPTLDD